MRYPRIHRGEFNLADFQRQQRELHTQQEENERLKREVQALEAAELRGYYALKRDLKKHESGWAKASIKDTSVSFRKYRSLKLKEIREAIRIVELSIHAIETKNIKGE